MKRQCVIGLLLSCLPAPALAAALPAGKPAPPQVGVVRCEDRSIRVVYGLPSNLFYGPIIAGVDGRAAFANDIGLLADARGLKLMSAAGSPIASLATNALGAMLGVAPSLAPAASLSGRALAWLPELSSIAAWNGSSFAVVRVDQFSGAVTSLVPLSATTAALLVSIPGGGITRNVVSLETGQIINSTLASPTASLMYERNGFTLTLDADRLTVSDGAGHMQSFPLTAPNVAIDSVADSAVVLQSQRVNSAWVLQLNSAALVQGTLRLSVLPGPPVTQPSRILRLAGPALPGSRGVQ